MLASDIIQMERPFFELLTGQLAGYQVLIKARTKQGLCVLVLDVAAQIGQECIDRWHNNLSFFFAYRALFSLLSAKSTR
jgi:hypothetical protein